MGAKKLTLEEEAEVCVEYYIKGKTLKEIAEQLGCTGPAVSLWVNPDRKQKDTESTAKRLREFANWKKEYLQTLKCAHCGSKLWQAFEFHHVDPSQKEENPGNIVNREKFLREIEKCICLCANCHRMEHWRLRRLDEAWQEN